MATSPWSRGTMVIMVLVAMSATIHVAVSLAAPASDVATAPGPKVIEQSDGNSDTPSTSEELIAAALKAGTITYEESLRQRAYALFDDPQLREAFRSPIIDWEAGRSLFTEIDQKEATLSKGLMADVAPFRARPNDSISIFNRPPSKKLSRASGATPSGSVRRVTVANQSQAHCTYPNYSQKLAERWESRVVPGTNVRIWIQGSQQELTKYETMVGKVWRAFPDYFTYPLPDNGNPCDETNPDAAVDMYLVIGNTVDPRAKGCAAGMKTCTLGGIEAAGVAQKTESSIPSKYSGYLLVDIDFPRDEVVLDTIAHELAHASQFAYDAFESSWLFESTATWVAYKVMKSLKRIPWGEYQLLEGSVSKRTALAPVFKNLHQSVNITPIRYGAWLFFYSASIDLGDNIVKDVWEKAETPGPDHIYAVDKAIPLEEHFPRYAVRSWNHDLTPQPWPYKTKDDTFLDELKPKPVVNMMFGGPGTEELALPVANLAARYYTFKFVDSIRKVTFENLYPDIPYAHVWAVKNIGGQWKEPEDWSKAQQKIFCRDSVDENLTELVIIVSSSHKLYGLPPEPSPRIIADAVGCEFVEGWAKASLRSTYENYDVRYVSNKVKLRFKPRASPLQNVPGNTQYDLMPTSVTWTASGNDGDCTISGQIVVNIPSFENQPLNGLPTHPAYGYLNVVGLDGGDFHTVEISAANPDAFFKETCPGSPPTVKDFSSHAVWLLYILHQRNAYEGPTIAFKGTKTNDMAKPTGFLDLLPPGVVLPEDVQKELGKVSGSGKSEVYTWEWELRPLTVGRTAGN